MKKKQKKNTWTPKREKAKNSLVRNGIILLLSIVFFFVSMYGARCFVTKVCGVSFLDALVRSHYTILMPKGALEVEVANTSALRELGLAGRKSIPNNGGMLFVFDTPGRYGWWVKDMLFPVDIVWINDDGIVVNIERNVSPDSYPKTYINESPASYVLEMNAKGSLERGLYIGSKVKISD
jgi:uncharacterized membrane protein (UPF0127 family)